MKAIYEVVADFNPKLWLKPLRKTSTLHLIKIAVFYHVVGLAFMYSGSAAVTVLVPDYEVPTIPVSISLAVSAGAVEEALFFGIPFYIINHPMIVLGSGILWSFVHLFNTETFTFSTLAYSSLFFTIPHIFFSLRTWISGKGWFAVAFHAVWNLGVLASYCSAGLRDCYLFGTQHDLLIDVFSITAAISSLVLVYILYRRSTSKNKTIRYIVWIPIVVLVISEVLLTYVSFGNIVST
ncbi:MAG: CAAX protease [Nitrosopumilaceae archaeon]|nr:CAAX protease [Nitrosopumilaceae archaeon]NIU01032.1 CAAX protease [Nitrosopumilaceae archaeon]NIU87466.1 CAAX protease [Nitrosopumilaceae archaeon]NIV65514.1 CAAX protease [Nitrosopumilaceae archaeon]NIX61634.1 CAAX protease [Nitrosopumilaceae archaeon]